MRLEFTYTLDDLREAAMPAIFAGSRRLYRHHWIGITALSFFITLIVIAVWATQSQLVEPGPPERLLLEILLTGIPAAVVLCLIGASVWKTWRKLRPLTNAKSQRLTNVVHPRIAVLIGWGASLGVWFIAHGHTGRLWQPTAAQLVIVRCGPWAVVLAAFALSSSLQRRWNAVERWLSQPGWQQPKTIELDEDGYRSSDALAQTHLSWACFAAARETENLLILVGYDDSQYLIPKRAFAGPDGFWRCRELLRSVVPRTQFLAQKPIGFPVQANSSSPVEALPWEWTVDSSLDSDLPADDDPAATESEMKS